MNTQAKTQTQTQTQTQTKKLPIKEINQKMLVLRSLCLFLLVLMVNSNPPEETVTCSSNNTNCTITNYLGEFPDSSICKAANVVFPKTEDELLSIVGNASRNNRKVRVITRFSHSIPKLVCTDGEDGLLIGTKNLNRTLSIDKTKMTITVECGVSLRELIKKAAEAGLVLPYTPYWSGLTIGGMLSTGAHGSSLWGVGSSIHDYVEEMRIVHPVGPTEGYAKITTVDTSHPHMNAVKVSLGVLGVISQVTLRLQPMFKRSVTILEKNDSNFAVMATTWGNQHEFGDMAWFPNQRKVLYRVDDRVPSNTSGNGLNDFTGFRSTPSIAIALIRSIEETKEATNSADGKCVVAKLTSSILKNGGFGYTNDGSSFKGYPIIGFQNRLQASSSCLDSPRDHGLSGCAWDPEIHGHQFYHQTTFSIGLSKVQNFIEDMQTLRDLKPEAFCGTELSAGILLRYVKRSDAYLGKEEDGIDFDITYYRSHDPLEPRLFEDILEEVEQIGLFKYGALPHWGKNRNIAFDGVIKKYEKASEFLKVKAIYDPSGIFSSKWTDQMLGLQGGVTILKKGCALEGLCICSQDIHCAPDKGYFCRPGRIYKDARVCSRRKIAAS